MKLMQAWASLSKRKRIVFIICTGVAVILAVGLYLHYPLMQNAGHSNGYTCSRAHIYIPRRLDFKGCQTVTGTVMRYKIEPDGDAHALLALDGQYRWLLTPQNYQKQQGYLVIEDT